MKTFMRTAVLVPALLFAAIAAADGASAMPNGVGSAQDVVRMLEADGLQVVLNPVGPGTLGATTLDRCTVSAVRPGPVAKEARNATVETAPHTTVFVDVKC